MVEGQHLNIFFTHADTAPVFEGRHGISFGGVEIQTFELIKALLQWPEIDINCLVCDDNAALPSYERVNFVRQRQTIAQGIPGLSRVINMRRRRTPYKGMRGTIAIGTIACEELLYTFYATKKAGMKFIYQLSSDVDLTGQYLDEPIRARYFESLTRMDGIIAQTSFQQEYLRCELGIESTLIRQGLADIPPEQNVERDIVLWVGRSVNLKRPWHFLEMARRIPEHHFVMVIGSSDVDLMSWIELTAKEISNLEIRKDVNYQEMPGLFARAKAFVHTSAIEGMPVVYFEALRASCPIFALSVDPDGMIANNQLGYYFDGDMEAMVSTTRTALASDAMVSEMGARARRYFLEHHLISVVAEKYVEYFRRM